MRISAWRETTQAESAPPKRTQPLQSLTCLFSDGGDRIALRNRIPTPAAQQTKRSQRNTSPFFKSDHRTPRIVEEAT